MPFEAYLSFGFTRSHESWKCEQLTKVLAAGFGPAKEPARSSSGDPLEQPSALTPEEFARRSPCPEHRQFTAARDETAALTTHIEPFERDLDARVAARYGL